MKKAYIELRFKERFVLFDMKFQLTYTISFYYIDIDLLILTNFTEKHYHLLDKGGYNIVYLQTFALVLRKELSC